MSSEIWMSITLFNSFIKHQSPRMCEWNHIFPLKHTDRLRPMRKSGREEIRSFSLLFLDTPCFSLKALERDGTPLRYLNGGDPNAGQDFGTTYRQIYTSREPMATHAPATLWHISSNVSRVLWSQLATPIRLPRSPIPKKQLYMQKENISEKCRNDKHTFTEYILTEIQLCMNLGL